MARRAVQGRRRSAAHRARRLRGRRLFAAAPRDEQEASINAAQYIQEGPALAAIVNEISEANIEHLSGKDMQSGAFLVYDGTKYGTATDDPNMVLFERRLLRYRQRFLPLGLLRVAIPTGITVYGRHCL